MEVKTGNNRRKPEEPEDATPSFEHALVSYQNQLEATEEGGPLCPVRKRPGRIVARIMCDHRLELEMRTVEEVVILWLNFKEDGKRNWDGTPNLLFVLSEKHQIRTITPA